MKNFRYLIALSLGFLNAVAMEPLRKKESDIIYTENAIEKMIELKLPQTEVQYVLLNGDVNKDKSNKGVLLYSQRSALPRPGHEKDQLIVAVAKEPYLGKKRILDVYYNKDVFVKKESKKPTAKEIRDATLKTRIKHEVAKQKERQERIEAKARKMKQAMEK